MKHTHTILYAEDEANDVFFLMRALQASGSPHALKAVVNGQEAMEYLAGKGLYADRAHYPFPALVLLDIKMPKKSGLEVLEWIRQQPGFKSLPVLMFTSSSHPEDIQTARRLGADDFLVKPPGLSELFELVESLCDRWLSEPVASHTEAR